MKPFQPSSSLRRRLTRILCLVLVISLSGCGTLLFPDRRGQDKGKVDPNVLILDGIGLLFFIIPGVGAFIIDLATGAIYLPPGQDRGEGPIVGEGGIFE